MNKDPAYSTLQRFFCAVFIGTVLAFAKADAQESTPVKNETSHLQAQFNVVDIHSRHNYHRKLQKRLYKSALWKL